MGASGGGARTLPGAQPARKTTPPLQAQAARPHTDWPSAAGTMALAPPLCGAFFWADKVRNSAMQMAKAGM